MSEIQKIKLLNVGDVVQLVSGGPLMTVECVAASEDSEIKDLVVFVEWFDSVHHIHQHSFFSKQLIGVQK